jgi:nucleotide-binding universal stress UspA family protein
MAPYFASARRDNREGDNEMIEEKNVKPLAAADGARAGDLDVSFLRSDQEEAPLSPEDRKAERQAEVERAWDAAKALESAIGAPVGIVPILDSDVPPAWSWEKDTPLQAQISAEIISRAEAKLGEPTLFDLEKAERLYDEPEKLDFVLAVKVSPAEQAKILNLLDQQDGTVLNINALRQGWHYRGYKIEPEASMPIEIVAAELSVGGTDEIPAGSKYSIWFSKYP